jgi:membrane protein DedA with SNARE-associated domain
LTIALWAQLLLQATPSQLKQAAGTGGKWKAFLNGVLAWGPGGLFLIAALDSAGIPIVGGVDLLLVNVAATRPRVAIWAALCAVAGSLLGCGILFAIARKGGELMLEKHIATGRGARLHAWFERYGLITVFLPALSPLPLPMKIPVFCAGALEVRTSNFLLVVFAARALRYFALAYFAVQYGAQTLIYLKAHWAGVSLIAAAIAAAAVVALQIRERRRRE